MRLRLLQSATAAFLLLLLSSPAAGEYRAWWVETFNTPLGTRGDIDRVISSCVESNCNAIFAQVRRRGDSWYLETSEPLTEVTGVGEPDSNGQWTLDPLRYLIEQAHRKKIEVHAFVIVGAVYNDDPTVRVPADPRHIFNQHFWDSSRSELIPYDNPRQWSTRALPHNLRKTAFAGRRFTGNGEWYIDLGHPEAAAHTVEVFAELVRNYAIDGIHLDRVRYPEAPIDTPFGMNVGYNETSVRRFKARYGDAARYYDNGYPRSNDPLWNQWRRDQVTNFVRRVYLTLTAIRPRIRVSAALIPWGSGPTATRPFQKTAPYEQVFQDWKGWAEEGIIDVIIPMAYKREHVPREKAQFDDWIMFSKTLGAKTGRHVVIGLGSYLNSDKGTLAQVSRARRYPGDGVIVFALGRKDPETARAKLRPAFVTAAAIPPMPWKQSLGSLMGFARRNDGTPLDAATVIVENTATGTRKKSVTDGSGFFGAAGLKPGKYRIRVTLGSETVAFDPVTVSAGAVAHVK